MTKLRQLIAYLEGVAPPALQAGYDNSGLLVGDLDAAIQGVLVSLDCTEAIVDEALRSDCNVVVAHHPIIFGGLTSLTGNTYVERTVMAAIRNDVAVYAIHTNLDSVLARGVNGRIAEQLGLEDVRVLQPTAGALAKLAVYVPRAHTDAVARALFAVGAGRLGRYDRASFRSEGTGTFRPLDGAAPSVGEVGADEAVAEHKLEVVVPRVLAKAAVHAAQRAHPYEEMAYDLYDVAGHYPDYGAGAIGELPEAMDQSDWLAYLCEAMELDYVRHTVGSGREVRRVAVCGGAGFPLLRAAKAARADAFVTADVKYHEFFDAETRLTLCDIGHYESERYTIHLLHDLISTRFNTFAARMTGLVTNPVRLFLPDGT